MFWKLSLIFTITFFCNLAMSVSDKTQIKKMNPALEKVSKDYLKGDYESAIEELNKLKGSSKIDRGLVDYWKGMSYSRSNDFENAAKYLRSSIELGFKSDDLFYEYGQALYVASKYRDARIAFKKSFNRKYKRGVSLYYIATISKEMKEPKKAVKFFKMISKLPKSDNKDVLQASKVQIADIYLEKIEQLPDSIKDIEKYVIPRYKDALILNDDSKLADEIKLKIKKLQKKYELVLFRMRNGRATARPPYYLRANFAYGSDDNVNQLSDKNRKREGVLDSDIASPFIQTGVFGRYSFYPNSSYSFAPELNVTTTKYLSDSKDIEPLNQYAITTGATLNFEHIYDDNPATFYVNFSYTYNANFDIDEDGYTYTGNDISVTLSEELHLFKNHPTTFRFRYGSTTTDVASQSFNSYALIWEQIINLDRTILFFTNSYTLNSYREEVSSNENNNTLLTRLDSIFPTFYGIFNPTLYASYTSQSFFDSDESEVQALTSLGINLNRPLSKDFYLSVDYGVNSQVAGSEDNTYSQNILTVNLDFIY